MTDETRLRLLSIALRVLGLIFVLGLFPLILVWGSPGWTWEPRQTEYEEMMVGIYATLGVFLFRAARDPLANRSLIWFTVWSSVVHGGIMAMQAFRDAHEHANLLGDVPALLLTALVLGLLMLRGAAAERHPAAA
jgi:hypothetical protein